MKMNGQLRLVQKFLRLGFLLVDPNEKWVLWNAVCFVERVEVPPMNSFSSLQDGFFFFFFPESSWGVGFFFHGIYFYGARFYLIYLLTFFV